jgi:hypothetical protein
LKTKAPGDKPGAFLSLGSWPIVPKLMKDETDAFHPRETFQQQTCSQKVPSLAATTGVNRLLFGTRRRLASFAAALLFAILGVVVLRPKEPPQPPIIVMAVPYRIVPTAGPIPDRWLPRSPGWGWLWKLRYALLGKPRTIDLISRIMAFAPGSLAEAERVLSNGAPMVQTNGVSGWVVQADEVGSLRARIQKWPVNFVAIETMVTTGEGTLSSLRTTTDAKVGTALEAGVRADFLPIVGKNSTDLTAVISSTAIITDQSDAACLQTNLNVAVRVQIPQRGGFFLLTDPGSDGSRRALFISSTISRPK